MIIQSVEWSDAPRRIRAIAICPICHQRSAVSIGNGHGTQVMCIGNHKRVECRIRELRGNPNPDEKCDFRCTSAKGFICSCACGGKNHGRDLMT